MERTAIAIDFDFGHTDPMLTLPQGIKARVGFTAEAGLELLDSAVMKKDG